MMKNDLAVIILAAGKGTRMNSELPKVLHPINNQPMILNVIKTAYKINAKPIIDPINFKRTFAINISTKPLIKTRAAVEKLFGKISKQINNKGPKTYHIRSLN